MPLDDLQDDVPLVRAGDRTVTRVIAGETLVVPIAGGTADLEAIFTLNAVASRIWQLLEHPITPTRIVESIVEEFEVTDAEARRDVAQFLESLRAAGLAADAGARG